MIDQWQNCYDDGWQGEIVPEAFSHPAKFSRGLIHRIYKHAKEMGWIEKGSWILDPFAGVALGGLYTLSMDLNWIGIELEEKFVKLGEQNIDLWNRQLQGWPNLGTARIIQGDSRRLTDVIAKADLVVSSPPFIDQLANPGQRLSSFKNISGNLHRKKGHKSPSENQEDYGRSPGQLGNLPEGSFSCVVSSPPYEGSIDHAPGNKNWDYTKGPAPGNLKQVEYGKGQNNLGNTSGNTFWSASKEIVEQCFELLKPGGHAIWVTKDYVKAKKRVPFSDRWLALCESVGFKLVCRHQAQLRKEFNQIHWINNEIKLIKERKSFFRRNAEEKAAAEKFWRKIDLEIQDEYIEKAKTFVTVKPTEKKIIQKAQTLLWKDFLKPVEEIETRIDFEDVICLVKN